MSTAAKDGWRRKKKNQRTASNVANVKKLVPRGAKEMT